MLKVLNVIYIFFTLGVIAAGFMYETWAIGLGFVLLISGLVISLGILGQADHTVIKQ